MTPANLFTKSIFSLSKIDMAAKSTRINFQEWYMNELQRTKIDNLTYCKFINSKAC